MHENHVAIAEAYYTAWGEKNVAGMEKFLHPDVRFISPLAETMGKEVVLGALKRGSAFFRTLTIRAKFGSGDQAMLVIDLDFPDPVGNVRTAVLMTFLEGLIAKIELFFDARRMGGLSVWSD